MAPKLFVNRFLVPKEGSSDLECEDAIEVRPSLDPDDALDAPLSAAVADGASESMMASRWAQSLVREAAEVGLLHSEVFGDPRSLSAELVRRAVEPWDDQIKEYCARRQAGGRPVQWYEQPGLEKGAYATLVALRLQPLPPGVPDEDGRASHGPAWAYTAVALGDSCLFHVSGGAATSFPLTASAEFGLNPRLLGSRNHDVDLIADRLSFSRGHLRDGDELLLATDALAAWFLRGCEDRSRPWLELGEAAGGGQSAFGAWVHEQREGQLMRNDDVALVRVLVRDEGAGDADGRDAG
ncbi:MULTISPECIES: hypothetical protein [unclassified Streptomyces]|uniref:hypothetical protein n=1 Tax=unclassified Streptomyces TaxID=2593676 RepID=UPI002E2880DC|nr:hypothetical protein [Streptomyces sp. NBC_00223]